MGINNRQRRAAKQKARSRRQRERGTHAQGAGPGDLRFDDEERYAFVDLRVSAALRRLARRRVEPDGVTEAARSLGAEFAVAADLLSDVVATWLLRLTGQAMAGGWSPADLSRLVRRTDPGWERALRTALQEHSLAGEAMPAGWRQQVEAMGAPEPLYLGRPGDLAAALGVSALVASAPLLDADAWRGSGFSAGIAEEHPQWHRVRSLLAKAESTQFGPEAEALVAKAQQLITRYALEHLAEQASSDATAGTGAAGARPVTRRLWLEAPYVRAKGAMVAAVAAPNRCRTALSEQHGFVILVGLARDVEATSMLVTSLLLQADAALLGPAARLNGRSTSRSYRQSFLMAYAIRIGERLEEAHAQAVEETGAESSVLPVLRDVERQVHDAFSDMVPHTEGRPVNINSGAGYVDGLSAADQAVLDFGDHLDQGRTERQLG